MNRIKTAVRDEFKLWYIIGAVVLCLTSIALILIGHIVEHDNYLYTMMTGYSLLGLALCLVAMRFVWIVVDRTKETN